MKFHHFPLFALTLFAACRIASSEILPPLGLYDPVTLRSTTTGDPYPTFPKGVNVIPPPNLDRCDDLDNALCILIRTPDIAATYQAPSFDSLLFSSGIYPTGSMNEYFLECSYGIFGVEGQVAGWYTAANNYSYYTWNNYGLGSYPHNAQKLVEEAVLAADAGGVDFSLYDNDGDGWVDALIVVHQGPGAEFTGSVNDIWSHRWAINPIQLDGVYVSDYSMDPELEGNGSSGKIEPIAVFSHEYTHLLGLPDLYDYDSKLVPSTFTTPEDDNDHPLMDWCIMGYGGYGISSYGKGATPTHHCGYFKYLLGWVEPTVLGLSQTNIPVPEVEENPVLYKIPINGSETEYFLIENRNSACPTTLFDHYDSDFSAWFNWFTPGHNPLDAGLIVYHIDESMPLNNGTPQYAHYGCRVLDAGYNPAHPWPNLEFTEWWYPYEFRIGATFCQEDDQTELTPITIPSTDGYGGPSGIYITHISASGSTMTFDLSFTTGTPNLAFASAYSENDGGDEDGFLDGNETGDLYVVLSNLGNGEARQISGILTCSDPYVEILNAEADFEDIGITLAGRNESPFQLHISGNCPVGYDAVAELELTWACGGATVTVPLELNWDVAFADDMEQGVNGWTHYAVGTNYYDQWHLTTQRNHTSGGGHAWKCGANGYGAYRDRLNAALDSPTFTAQGETRIAFWHRMTCEDGWDGGIIETSVAGVWQQISPIGGYPDQIEHSSSGCPFAFGTPCFSSDFGWKFSRAVIPDAGGNTEVRFRFGSDQYTGAEGWYIDDVRIYHGEDQVAIGEEIDAVPKQYTLSEPFPNPFNPTVTLAYELPTASSVRLTIYDLQGRRIAEPLDGFRTAGVHAVIWNAKDAASGIYFYRFEAGDFIAMGKMFLMK